MKKKLRYNNPKARKAGIITGGTNMWIGSGANRLYVQSRDIPSMVPMTYQIEEELLHLDDEETEEIEEAE